MSGKTKSPGTWLGTRHSFSHGSKAVGTSEVALTATSDDENLKGILVKAASTNSGIVYVGKTGVTANSAEATDGFELTAGESVFIEANDPSIIFVIASATSQKVFWIGV